jgi:hypothetical protein
MTSHIRYRGFQGSNIRRVTPPISFDGQGLAALLGGAPFRAWRAAGGLVVADSLGVRAVRRYFDPRGDTLPHRDVARRALLAGNDLLILAQFAAESAWSSQRANITDTLAYFASEYERDPAFRARVDDAGRRVLRRKAELYPAWEADAVAADPAGAAQAVGLDASREAVLEVGRAAVSAVRLVDHPMPGDRLVIVTDDEHRLACPGESCGLPPARAEALAGLGPTLVEAFVLERYGARGTGVMSASDVRSLTFCQLRAVLAPPLPEPEAGAAPTAPAGAPGSGPSLPAGDECASQPDVAAVLGDLATADWIVFAFGELKPSEISALRGFYLPQVSALSHDGGAEARLAVLSFGPPYYIDATNLARLEAYIAAYSKVPASIEAAVEALFGERDAPGAPPVTIDDADYDLTYQLEPAADSPLAIEASAAGRPIRALPARVEVRVGPVLDRNGNRVPDGTPVELRVEPAAAHVGGPSSVGTRDGMAVAEIVLAGAGPVTVSAESGEAASADTLRFVLAPPTATPSATSAAPSGTPDPPSASPDGEPDALARAGDAPTASDLLLALAAIAAVNGASLAAGGGRQPIERRLRSGLAATAGGLTGFLVFGLAARLQWPGATAPAGLVGAVGLAALGSLAGLVWAARQRATGPASPPAPRAAG